MYSLIMMNRMINSATKEVMLAKDEEERNSAINRLDVLIALRKDMVESKSDTLFKLATLGISAAGVFVPVIANTKLIKDCINFEENGIWSHPTAKGLASKIRLGK